MPPFDRFAIGFDHRDRARLQALWDEVIDAERWSEGGLTEAFETRLGASNGLPAVAFASWSGAALAALEYAEVPRRGRALPVQHLHGDAALGGGLRRAGRVRRLPTATTSACRSRTSSPRRSAHRPRAAFVVHIGGHIAFDIERIADYCRQEGIFLIEDCAHAHGASWNGRRAGTWGDAGVWSFAATKTISTGEGGMLVSRHDDLIEFARAFRNYGKPSYDVAGLNFRMNEFTAAIGIVQTERLDEIVAWKNAASRASSSTRVHPGAARAARGDGLRPLQVHRLRPDRRLDRQGLRRALPPPHGAQVDLPATDWVADEPLVRAALLPARGGRR